MMLKCSALKKVDEKEVNSLFGVIPSLKFRAKNLAAGKQDTEHSTPPRLVPAEHTANDDALLGHGTENKASRTRPLWAENGATLHTSPKFFPHGAFATTRAFSSSIFRKNGSRTISKTKR